MWYVAECYNILQRDNPIYSKKWCAENTSFKFEDYIKMELVDKYLIKYKSLIINKLLSLEQINFSYETQKRFKEIKGKEKVDKIDIYINKLGLQNVWKEEDENIYFAIECKRINKNSDYYNYIGDIEKFCNRKHSQLRLPFEGMIAFLENKKFDHKIVSDQINQILKKNKTITTTQYLKYKLINPTFNGSYSSNHKRDFSKNESYIIYHLLFDYSKNIVG